MDGSGFNSCRHILATSPSLTSTQTGVAIEPIDSGHPLPLPLRFLLLGSTERERERGREALLFFVFAASFESTVSFTLT